VRGPLEKMKYIYSANGGLQIAHNSEKEMAVLAAIAERLRPLYDGFIIWKERGDGLYEAKVDTSRYPHGSLGGGGAIMRFVADSEGNLLSSEKIGVAPVLPCP
jgi:hypothetical protein